ncbi:hypothetical protein HIM_08775 [Hirsutella minnesotensis 3608]|uniref:Uncharacterized protein n=1 Tax=Hirsutella minnesotensis 3608 TaxID=1043627 RepID=A0A0F7ZY48_9HYPO|nr:hypothetical protein HIM_08775 [Hirsutella minnesotensis 3608]
MKPLALALLSLVSAAPSPRDDLARLQLVDLHFYEGRPVSDFMQHRRNEQGTAPSPDPATRLDWTTDGCSVPGVSEALAKYPGLPKAFDFADPCTRHDFGYRNYPKSALGSRRDAVDRQFREDMKAVCAASRPVVRPFCYSMAEVYYAAVSGAGAKHFGQKPERTGRVEGGSLLEKELQPSQVQDILNNIEQAGQALGREKSG